MADYSHLDKQYFIDSTVYNCPFCNRNNVPYQIYSFFSFNWSEKKTCHGIIVLCDFCKNKSMHLSYEDLLNMNNSAIKFDIKNIDSKIFYSVPTSYFVLDERIPSIIRELISEAEGSLKMNYLTGASACMRKAIYELLVFEKIAGEHYEDRIKALKVKHPAVDTELFDILAHIQNMTSDKVHEQSWDKWDSKYLKFIIETLKTVLYDMYVLPNIKSARAKAIMEMKEALGKKNDTSTEKGEADEERTPAAG